jgi:hypothetical protein
LKGAVSRGFEDFTISDESCPTARTLVWLEYGGPEPAKVTYCCESEEPTSHPNGKDPLRIGGIETLLVRDETFRRFDRMTSRLRRGKTVHASLVGWYFSGEEMTLANGEIRWVGYGHLGLHSLFVIEQVLSADAR